MISEPITKEQIEQIKDGQIFDRVIDYDGTEYVAVKEGRRWWVVVIEDGKYDISLSPSMDYKKIRELFDVTDSAMELYV